MPQERPLHWTQHLSPELQKELAALHKVNPKTAVRILVYCGVWAASASLVFSLSNIWLKIPCWILIGFCLHGLGDFMHMCSHGRVFGKEWLDRLVGFLCGAAVGISCSNYRANHLLHHRYLNTDKDPDYLHAIPWPRIRKIIYYTWFIIGIPIYTIRLCFMGPFTARGLKEKCLCVAETVILIQGYILLFSWASKHGFLGFLLEGWLAAGVFGNLIANVRGLAEHSMLSPNPEDHPLHASRTTLSTRLISFFFNNQNYHLEHHLFPSMPWHNLAKAHQLLRPIYEEEQASIAGGYLQFVQDSFHHGPEVRLDYHPLTRESHPNPDPNSFEWCPES